MKKLFMLSLAFLLAILFIPNANAAKLTVYDLEAKIKELDYYKGLMSSDDAPDEIGFIADDDSFTIKMKINDEESTTEFSYDNGTISYIAPDYSEDKLGLEKALIDNGWIMQIITIAANNSGFSSLDIELIDWITINYEKNGIEVGVTDSPLVPFESIKVNLNNVDLITLKTDKAPNIKIEEVTDETIPIQLTGEKFDDKDVKCTILRSTDNKNWSFLAHINCVPNFTYHDTDVEKDTTYYYKATYVGAYNYSETVSAQLNEDSTSNSIGNKIDNETNNIISNSPSNTTDKESPETGSFLPILSIGTLFIIGYGVISHINKNEVFR